MEILVTVYVEFVKHAYKALVSLRTHLYVFL